MAIHLDYNRKRKGLTQEDLPNVPSASHASSPSATAELQRDVLNPNGFSLGPLWHPYSPLTKLAFHSQKSNVVSGAHTAQGLLCSGGRFCFFF